MCSEAVGIVEFLDSGEEWELTTREQWCLLGDVDGGRPGHWLGDELFFV